MNAKDIEKILVDAWVEGTNKHIDSYNERYPEFTHKHVTPSDLDGDELPGILPLESEFGTISFVEERGGEGDGAPMYLTLRVGDRYFEMQGRYSSWDASTWDPELYEVSPKEVTVVKFERKA